MVLVLGSVIGGFNDPTFGIHARSAETLVGVMGAFAVAIAVWGVAAHRYRRARRL